MIQQPELYDDYADAVERLVGIVVKLVAPHYTGARVQDLCAEARNMLQVVLSGVDMTEEDLKCVEARFADFGITAAARRGRYGLVAPMTEVVRLMGILAHLMQPKDPRDIQGFCDDALEALDRLESRAAPALRVVSG